MAADGVVAVSVFANVASFLSFAPILDGQPLSIQMSKPILLSSVGGAAGEEEVPPLAQEVAQETRVGPSAPQKMVSPG